MTARIYTDIGIFTSNPNFGQDAAKLFNYLTSYSHPTEWNDFIVAPITFYKKLTDLIDREIEKTTPENPGMIFAKMNQLAHKEIIAKLYQASQAGVKIKLLVRGVCCLKPGLPNISENIEIRSILGRFLEHSRIFYFKNGGEEEIFLSSADWMTRNIHSRVELMFPTFDENIKKHLKDILDYYWKDNTAAWRLNSDGSYNKLVPEEGETPFNAQTFFVETTYNHKNKTRK